MDELKYLSGFGNHFATEALPNALPQGQNSPQQVNLGLYAEQLSGSAFTAPKGQNLRSWLYRIQPSVVRSQFQLMSVNPICEATENTEPLPPAPMRWNPLPSPEKPTTWFESLMMFASNGTTKLHQGANFYLYACNKNMEREFFTSADGELLIVPQEGRLLFRTEFGLLHVAPEEILIVPRGVKFQVHLLDKSARGYVCENHGLPFRLPERGLIGSNGLANERDFLYPVAFYEDIDTEHQLFCKFSGNLWQADLAFSPLNVVAWHGNYAPYKYALKNFNSINSVSFDHCDPSIFTVLTSPSAIAGTSNLDFVIFPERWSVAEHTFRLPYFHRNVMSELMGLIKGEYDAKASGFHPGGVSIHNCLTPHGPDAKSVDIGMREPSKPHFIKNTLAFMLESCFCWIPSKLAMGSPLKQKDYAECWQELPKKFKSLS